MSKEPIFSSLDNKDPCNTPCPYCQIPIWQFYSSYNDCLNDNNTPEGCCSCTQSPSPDCM